MAKPAPKKSAPAKKEAAKAVAVAKKAPARAEARKDESKAVPATGATKAPAKKTAAKTAEPAKRTGASPFDARFLDGQRELLLEERAKLLGSAERLEGEAASLMEDLDPGDVQFDAALVRIVEGTYGFSVVSGRAIPKDRLRAIPWATELVEEKVGGLGTRR